jgi:hypothetical protein
MKERGNVVINVLGVTVLALLVLASVAGAQNSLVSPFTIQWQKCLGGSGVDIAYAVQQTVDGGYIVAGWTTSFDGDVTGHHGNTVYPSGDCWLIKLDSNGNKMWQKCLGGSYDDGANAVQQTSDGGYILAGYTQSNDGDVAGNHGNPPFPLTNDYWVVKLKANGDIDWQKCLGGSGMDEAYAIQQTSDGGYIVAGHTASNDGDVTGYHGSGGNDDYWVVKLKANGDIDWRKCLGGSGDDGANAVKQTPDGGYIVAGQTMSNDGDLIGNHGGYDYGVVKLKANGDIEWAKCLGGSGNDIANAVQQTSDGGYIMAGFTLSNNGDVSGNHGGFDYWVVKLKANGDIDWQKCLGGSGYDIANAVQQTPDGGYIVGGYTFSNNGDVSGNHGSYDYWVVKLKANGDIDWQKCLGGSNWDEANAGKQTSDGGYIVAGYTSSNNGDVSGYHGDEDYWVVKLVNQSATTTQPMPEVTPSGASQKTNNQIKIGNQDQYAAAYGSGSVASNIVIAPRIDADSTCIITIVGNSDEGGNKVRAKVAGAKIDSDTAQTVGQSTGEDSRDLEKESTCVKRCEGYCNRACSGRESCDVEACVAYCKEDENC